MNGGVLHSLLCPSWVAEAIPDLSLKMFAVGYGIEIGTERDREGHLTSPNGNTRCTTKSISKAYQEMHYYACYACCITDTEKRRRSCRSSVPAVWGLYLPGKAR